MTTQSSFTKVAPKGVTSKRRVNSRRNCLQFFREVACNAKACVVLVALQSSLTQAAQDPSYQPGAQKPGYQPGAQKPGDQPGAQPAARSLKLEDWKAIYHEGRKPWYKEEDEGNWVPILLTKFEKAFLQDNAGAEWGAGEDVEQMKTMPYFYNGKQDVMRLVQDLIDYTQEWQEEGEGEGDQIEIFANIVEHVLHEHGTLYDKFKLERYWNSWAMGRKLEKIEAKEATLDSLFPLPQAMVYPKRENQNFDGDDAAAKANDMPVLQKMLKEIENETWVCMKCTFTNMRDCRRCSLCLDHPSRSG